MARPTEEVVLWAAQDVTLPALEGPNKVLPISDLINKGWDMNQKPAADEFNYLLNNYAKWLIYLDEKSGGASPDAPIVDSLPSTTPLRDTDGKGCFKGIKASDTTNANAFNMIDTYNSKTAVSVSVDGNEIGNFVYNGLISSGDGKSGLACNTAGTHYGNVEGNVTGNADTAIQWKQPLTLELSGAVRGSGSFDGNEGRVTIFTSDYTGKIGAFNNLVWTGTPVATKSFTRQNLYTSSGFPQDAGILDQFNLTIILADGNNVATTKLPIQFITTIKNSFTLYIDYGDSSDWCLDVTYSQSTFTFTSTQRGGILAVYITS